ncbi:putative short-chain dehydrogenase/reductase [Tsukamurella sp. TY48]|uniref:SDR family NAD(P)-dependent oxidoreductase n=1 Tax=Tsukamurella sp. TY48 TaxID=2775495 RepID=UPI001C7D06B7|nr:SDR family NAD(P)-dependent oxidoreductase [Tsukamurella sp. TY48]GIZ96649.1 putative short-chain dehydrogenase/reductase [Tsukamurella sp. TY48]
MTTPTYVVTGANGGLGQVVTRRLAATGGRVVMACRDVDGAQRIADGIDGDVTVGKLDLGDLDSVRAFADTVGEVDVLVNNAGLMNIPLKRTKQGFEMQFGVNHLGHFLLTGLLLDRLTDRVVAVSSVAHRQNYRWRMDDPNYEHRKYLRSEAYGQSKLANMMFARELQRRFEAAGSDKRAYYVHPGVSPTGLFTRTETPLDRVARQAVSLLSNPPEQAAEALVLAATDRDLDPHPWWGPSQLFQTRGRVGKCSTTAESKDTAKWAELWDVSERLTGFTYPV